MGSNENTNYKSRTICNSYNLISFWIPLYIVPTGLKNLVGPFLLPRSGPYGAKRRNWEMEIANSQLITANSEVKLTIARMPRDCQLTSRILLFSFGPVEA